MVVVHRFLLEWHQHQDLQVLNQVPLPSNHHHPIPFQVPPQFELRQSSGTSSVIGSAQVFSSSRFHSLGDVILRDLQRSLPLWNCPLEFNV